MLTLILLYQILFKTCSILQGTRYGQACCFLLGLTYRCSGYVFLFLFLFYDIWFYEIGVSGSVSSFFVLLWYCVFLSFFLHILDS